MVQKVNPNLAQGVIGVPSNMYFQMMQFLGVFRPFLQRFLDEATSTSQGVRRPSEVLELVL